MFEKLILTLLLIVSFSVLTLIPNDAEASFCVETAVLDVDTENASRVDTHLAEQASVYRTMPTTSDKSPSLFTEVFAEIETINSNDSMHLPFEVGWRQ